MPASSTTDLIRDSGMSVIASDIPVYMTVAQYRKRPGQTAAAAPRKLTTRLLRRER
jgi:hypothetical protein